MVKVIIAITTYNLEKYIAEALDSVLSQETNFDFKIVVADDCSKDGTIQILEDYKKRYPDKIELLLTEKNMGSLANSNRIFDGLQCEYFSFLDGDDYWVGNNRLQKQVDFMDSHPEYMLCAGNTQYLRDGQLSNNLLKNMELDKTYFFKDMLENQMPFFHTSSILVRNSIFSNGLPACYRDAENTFENCALRGEDFRRILHLEKGPLYAMDEVLSVYRIHENGIWQGSSQTRRFIEGAIGYNFYKKYFGNKYGDYFKNEALKSYRSMMRHLVLENNLLQSFTLSEKDTYLFTALLNDLKNNEGYINRDSKIKKKLQRFIFSILMKINLK